MSDLLLVFGFPGLGAAIGAALGSIPSYLHFRRRTRQVEALVTELRAERVLPPAGAGTGAMAAHRLRQEAGQAGSEWTAT